MVAIAQSDAALAQSVGNVVEPTTVIIFEAVISLAITPTRLTTKSVRGLQHQRLLIPTTPYADLAISSQITRQASDGSRFLRVERGWAICGMDLGIRSVDAILWVA